MRGVERGASLTSRLLAFARRQELSAPPVDVGALVCGMDDLLARSLGPAVSVRRAIAPGLPPALVDPHQLELALLNLAVNARDAMPEGGELTIAASAVELGPRNREKLAPAPMSASWCRTPARAWTAARWRRRRALLHDQGTRQGHGPRPADGAGPDGAVARGHDAGEQARPRHARDAVLPVAPTPADAPRPSPTSPTASRTPPAMTSNPHPAAPAPAPSPRAGTRARTVLVVDDDPLVAMGTVAMLEDLGHPCARPPPGARRWRSSRPTPPSTSWSPTRRCRA